MAGGGESRTGGLASRGGLPAPGNPGESVLRICKYFFRIRNPELRIRIHEAYWDTGSELYVFIGQLLKLNWLYTELGDFLPVHYTPIFTPQTVGGFINNILAHHD